MFNTENIYATSQLSEFAKKKCSKLIGSEKIKNQASYKSASECKVENKSNSMNGWGLTNYPLASVYSPVQNFTELYNCETGLIKGTIFSELDLPFVCGGISGGVSRG